MWSYDSSLLMYGVIRRNMGGNATFGRLSWLAFQFRYGRASAANVSEKWNAFDFCCFQATSFVSRQHLFYCLLSSTVPISKNCPWLAH